MMMEPDNLPPGFERYLRPIFDHMFEGIQIIDFDWRYVYVNATAASHGRRAKSDLVGRRMMEVFPGIERTEMLSRLERCITEREPQSVLNEFTYPDGDTGWFDLRMSPVPTGVLVLSIDTTAARTVEAQLHEAGKLEAIGRLAGGVAHDFNNLLTVIGGYSDLVLSGMSPEDPFRHELEEIHRASERATALTQQLLAFSRRQMLELRVLDLNEVVSRMDTLLRRLIGADVDLVTRVNPDAGNVVADPSQLEQIIMNLAVNARDAMPNGGKLTIQTDNVELDDAYARTHVDATPGPHVMLAVSDTGTGMDSDTKSRIFEPFFTTKELGKGTGLGLATVYGIVKQSGGNIWVYSEPGRGTTIKVYLPLVVEPASSPRPEATKPPAPTTGTETVLVVEDDAPARRFVRDVLQSAGYTVLDTGETEEAVHLAMRHPGPIHLLLTDIVLPGGGGRELAERVLAVRPGLHVIYMSGYTDDAIVHRGVLDPNTPFIDKPIAADALLLKLREIMDRFVPAS
jgi:two-component system, cell cycle sensor histidine kinase and response regulator CckA